MSAEPEVVENEPSVEPVTKKEEIVPDLEIKEEAKEESPPTEDEDGQKISDLPSSTLFYPSNSKLVIAEALDNYFEQDENLKLQYDTEQPVESLLELPLVKATNPDLEILIAAVELCKKLTLDKTKALVRASTLSQRVTLILRDLPEDVKYMHIKTLLESEDLTSQLTSRVKEIRPELNNNWFVSFANQDDCLNAALWLNLYGKIGDKKVRCRVKSVLPQSTYNAARAPAEGQGFEHYYSRPGQQYYGGNYGSQYPPQQPSNQRRNSGRNRKGRGNNNRGGGRYNNNNYNNNNTNNNSNNFNGRSPRQSGMKGRRNSRAEKKTVGRNAIHTLSPKSSPQQRPRLKPEATATGKDIDYPGEFVLLDRTNFSQIINDAQTAEEVPMVPPELDQYPDLKSGQVKQIDFEIGSLMTGSAISPYPSAKQGPVSGEGAPPDFALDGGEPEKKKKKKKTKKKEKVKAVAKPITESPKKLEVVYDDEKETEEKEPVPDFAAASNEI